MSVAYSFNAQQFSPQFGGGGGLPVNPDGSPAKYRVIIAESSQETTKDQQGGYLLLSCKCIEGPFTGVSQDIRLNLHNKSAQAVEIANKQLTAICYTVGHPMGIQVNTGEIHNIPFFIEVRKQRTNPEFTEVSAVFDANGNAPSAAPQQQQAPQPPQQPPAGVAPGTTAPPWAAPAAAPAPAVDPNGAAAWPGTQPGAQPPAQQPQAGWPPAAAPASAAPPWQR